MDFGRPNVEIGRKMANGQLLFLALLHVTCKTWKSYFEAFAEIKFHKIFVF